MYHYIDVSENYPDNLWLRYQHEKNPDYLQFLAGRSMRGVRSICFGLKSKAAVRKINEWDMLQTDCGGVLVVGARFAAILKEFADFDCQFFPAIIGVDATSAFYAVNIVNNVDCIDFTRSLYRSVEYGDLKKISMERYAFRPNALGDHQIVRSTTPSNFGNLPDVEVVGDLLSRSIQEANLNGVVLVPGE